MSIEVKELKLVGHTPEDIIDILTAVVNAATKQTREELRAEIGEVKNELRLLRAQIGKLTNGSKTVGRSTKKVV